MVVHRPVARVRRESDPPGTAWEGRAGKIRQAAQWAELVYPGPVGQYLAREIGEFERLGQMLGSGDALMWAMIEDILTKARGRGDDSARKPAK